MPGVTRGILKIKILKNINFLKKKNRIFEETPGGTQGFHRKLSAHSVQPFGQL